MDKSRLLESIFALTALLFTPSLLPAIDLPFEPVPIKPEYLEMVFIKGGCFQMGDTFGDGAQDEKAVHKVCIDNFYLGRYEVTQRQWVEVMGNNPSIVICDDCPVERVSWYDAQEFLKRLNQKTGGNYRLPAEAEWEYAARSGGKEEKYAGTSNEGELEEYAWYYDNSGNKTHPAGQKKPNGLGLYDMTGNVWEWVADWYDENYYSRSPEGNPKGPDSGIGRVLRGGSCDFGPTIVRAAYRFGYYPDSRKLNFSGFRIAR